MQIHDKIVIVKWLLHSGTRQIDKETLRPEYVIQVCVQTHRHINPEED